MGSPRFVCHRCRAKWKTSRHGTQECPRCGHTLVGPTDPAPGRAVPALLLGLGLLAAAWWLGLLPGEAEQALERARETVEEAAGRVGEAASEGRAPARSPAQGSSQRDAPRREREDRDAPARAEKAPAPSAPSAEAKPPAKGPARLAVYGVGGARAGDRYLVRGRVRNEGGAEAQALRVTVEFLGPGGEVLGRVDAEPSARSLAPGASCRFAAELRGEAAARVAKQRVTVDFRGAP